MKGRIAFRRHKNVLLNKYLVGVALLAYINDMTMNELSLGDWRIYDTVIKRIQAAFNEQFECANPDKASNRSRDKIAHGHVVEAETEVNSLKQFFYLNEIYRLFTMLDEKCVVQKV